MAMFENFPYTNLHELNLDWIIKEIKNMESTSVLSVNGETGYVTLYQNATVEFPEITANNWQIVRTANGVMCGIAFDKNGTAYFVKGSNYDKLYSEANQPPYPVTSVNGMTGNIELFTEQYIRLPNLTDEEMTQWNIYRHLNGVTSGIQFKDDGTASLMVGNNRYQLYTSHDQPPYPVTSVNGQTGAITLYPFADVELPEVEQVTDWSIHRVINNVDIGISFDSSGSASLVIGNDSYPLYIQGLNDPSDFDNPLAPVLEISENLSTGTQWGIIRSLQNDDQVGIVFVYDSGNQVYNGYLKTNNTLTKLLTLDDIPSTTGVISVNGQTGVVTLDGSNLHVSNSDSTPISTALSGLSADLDELRPELAIVINGDTASKNINAKDIVIVINSTIQDTPNGLYRAVNAVTAGTPVGSADLSPVTRGGLNLLRLEMNTNNTSACTSVHSHVNVKQNSIVQIGNICIVSIAVDITDAITTNSYLMTVPTAYRPDHLTTANFALLNINDSTLRANPNNVRIDTSGHVFQNLTSTWSSGYIEALFIYKI